MNYLPRNKYRRSYSRKITFVVTLFIGGVILLSFLDNVLITAISPLWRAENGFSRSLGKSIDFFRSRGALINENTMLKDRLALLESEHSELSLKDSEIENLRTLLGRTASTQGIAATILTRPPQSPYDLVVIDAGFRNKISSGSRVTLPEGPEIGTVVDVFPTFSKVKLYSTSGEKTSAVLERHQVPVTLEGIGGGNFKIIVPRETEVVVGDRVLSASFESTLVAVVEDVEVTATDAFKEVLARGPANIFSIRFVTVTHE
ncbi:MAG: rod shape-determining protein MreC [Patescibacteria group bacterium]